MRLVFLHHEGVFLHLEGVFLHPEGVFLHLEVATWRELRDGVKIQTLESKQVFLQCAHSPGGVQINVGEKV